MNDTKTTIKDLITKPPVVFPLVALFHFILLGMSLVSMIKAPAFITELSALWMLGYTIAWLGATAMRKWGAILYILITTADVVTWYSATTASDKTLLTSNLFLISLIFSFFIILYYRKLR